MPDVEFNGRPAFVATPPVGEGPWPGVVVIHEVFGVNDDIREHTLRIAAAGYVAVAPDLYRGRGALRCVLGAFRTLQAGRGTQFDDIEAVRSALAERDDCTGRVGIIGFCMGGGFALLSAARGFDVSAPNYARLPKDMDVLRGSCPIVASYGGRDRGLRGASSELSTALDRLGVENDVVEYPDAGHSFLSRHPVGPLGPVLMRVPGIHYDQPSAEDAWGRIFRFFARHLG